MRRILKTTLGSIFLATIIICCKPGDMGPMGEVGPAGEAGNSGQNGPTGKKGATGATGAQGDKGLPGQNGAAGIYSGFNTGWQDVNWKLDPTSDNGLGSTYIYKFEYIEPKITLTAVDKGFYSFMISAKPSLLNYKLIPRLFTLYRTVGGNTARINYEIGDSKITLTARVGSNSLSGISLQDSLNNDQLKFQFALISK